MEQLMKLPYIGQLFVEYGYVLDLGFFHWVWQRGFSSLDQGFFHSIQSIQHTASPTTIEELIASMVNSYNAITHTTLNDIFLTLQKVMESWILSDGNNNFKTPHYNKQRLENLDQLSISIALSPELEEKLEAAWLHRHHLLLYKERSEWSANTKFSILQFNRFKTLPV